MRLTPLVLAAVIAAPASAQKAADHMALGAAASAARDPEEALRHFQAALAADSQHFDANARAAEAAMDIGGRPDQAQSDSFFSLAERYARRALAVDSTRPEGHYLVAAALSFGAMAAHKRGKDRPEDLLSTQVNESIARAVRATEIDPRRDLPYFIRAFWYMWIHAWKQAGARPFDPALTDRATLENARAELTRAVELAPSSTKYRFNLAHLHVALGKPDEARAQLEAIEALPVAAVHDERFKAMAKTMLSEMATKAEAEKE